MTVAHLNTVGFRTLDVIAQLQTGEVPRSEVRIEDVKPTDDLSVAEVRSQFEQLQIKANSPEASVAVPRGQGPRYPHPWFGLLDAFQWHCLIAMHQGIHRKQIEQQKFSIPRRWGIAQHDGYPNDVYKVLARSSGVGSQIRRLR